MFVKCIGNEAEHLPEHYRKVYAPEGYASRKWPLMPGKIYVCCAIAVYDGHLLYLLRNEDDPCPEFIPAPLFAVVNGRISKSWSYWAVCEFFEGNLESVLGYPELTNGSQHYDDLIDGRVDAIALYERREQEIRKELTDIESTLTTNPPPRGAAGSGGSEESDD